MIRREPILAWRVWRLSGPHVDLSEPQLESCVYGDPWLPREAFVAECPSHARPAPGCGCGIYAVTSKESALALARWAQSALPHPIVIGRVHLWGRVLPHSTGYRSERAYPYDLEVVEDGRWSSQEQRRLTARLRARYVVDVSPDAAA